MIRITTIDAHVAGQPLRLVTGGAAVPRGSTMADRQREAALQLEWVRTVVREPRGGRDLVAALLTEPVAPEAHAGVLLFDADGWSPAPGSALLAVASLALRYALMTTAENGVVRLETLDGVVEVRVHESEVSLHAPPARVTNPGGVLRLPEAAHRRGPATLRVDEVECGGRLIVTDAEAAGVPLDLAHLERIRSTGVALLTAASGGTLPEARYSPVAPRRASAPSIAFTSPAYADNADLRVVLVDAAGRVERSPSVQGAAALTALLEAMAFVSGERPLVIEGLCGLGLSVSIARRDDATADPATADAAIVARIAGRVFVTGEHTFIVEEQDPL